jgi:hypothetical protein
MENSVSIDIKTIRTIRTKSDENCKKIAELYEMVYGYNVYTEMCKTPQIFAVPKGHPFEQFKNNINEVKK